MCIRDRDWPREIIKDIKAQDDEYLLQTLTGKEEGELLSLIHI